MTDLGRWLEAHGAFDPRVGRLEWDWEHEQIGLDPRDFAVALRRHATEADGMEAALALDAIADVVWWVSEIRGDVQAQPRVDGTAAWLEAFTDAVLDEPGFVRACALAYVPQLPLGEHHYVDTKVEARLGELGASSITEAGALAADVTASLEDRGSDAAAERIWWAVRGGTAGSASRLVRAAEIAAFAQADRRRRPAVVALRAALVDAVTMPLRTVGLPFWARVWLIEPIARVDRGLVEELIVVEQMPWLAAHMRYQLGLSDEDRRARWNTWVVP
jgi:hypothetical protein